MNNSGASLVCRKFTVTPGVQHTFSYKTTAVNLRWSLDTGGVTTDPLPAANTTGDFSFSFTTTASAVWVTFRWDNGTATITDIAVAPG